jgi:hypothetical protein
VVLFRYTDSDMSPLWATSLGASRSEPLRCSFAQSGHLVFSVEGMQSGSADAAEEGPLPAGHPYPSGGGGTTLEHRVGAFLLDRRGSVIEIVLPVTAAPPSGAEREGG